MRVVGGEKGTDSIRNAESATAKPLLFGFALYKI